MEPPSLVLLEPTVGTPKRYGAGAEQPVACRGHVHTWQKERRLKPVLYPKSPTVNQPLLPGGLFYKAWGSHHMGRT